MSLPIQGPRDLGKPMLPLRRTEQRFFLSAAAVYGLITVLFGALGSHVLHGYLNPDMIQVFDTGILYQMFHTLILAVLGGMDRRPSASFLVKSGWFFFFGIPLFSGSLYALAITGFRVFGILTPIGGLLFLIGWVMFFLGSVQNQD